MPKPNLQELLELARNHTMTPAEQSAQRLSFAFGNANMSNPKITRARIEEAAKRITEQK